MARIEELEAENKALKAQLVAERVGGAFNRSRFVAEKLAIPPDIAQARFGSAFSVENGVVVATDAHGNRILSRERPGELAAFDEAMETLVTAYPHRDAIMRREGGERSDGARQGGRRKMLRKDFQLLSNSERHHLMVETAPHERPELVDD